MPRGRCRAGGVTCPRTIRHRRGWRVVQIRSGSLKEFQSCVCAFEQPSLQLCAASAAVVVGGQARLPPDIKAESLSRLPLVQRSQLDDEGKKIWDHIGGERGMPKTGPAPISMYSPKAAGTDSRAEPVPADDRRRQPLLRALGARRRARVRSAVRVVGARAGRPCAPACQQAAIDAVKFNRDVTGLVEKDATVIRLGRALLRDHKVSPELWAKTVELFGPQGAVEITTTIGDYVMAGLLLTAVDQQLPPERKPLLPMK